MSIVPHPVLTTAPAPATSAEVQHAVREARAAGTPLRIVGRGCWLDAGRPVAAARQLALSGLSGIVAYTPGDLTITALAGTTLGEVAAVARAERQFLALDPPGGDDGSLGATVATASAGPLAHAFGTPRDNVLGVEFVTGAGALVRGGGRVVKNVAGFDLTRLVTGAWGTLGVLTEVTVRLRALPAADVTLAVPLPATGLAAWIARVRSLATAPYCLELVDAALARRLGLPAAPLLLARVAGNETVVASQVAHFAAVGDVLEVNADVWSRLRSADPPSAVAARFSALPRDVASTWEAALAAVRTGDPAAGFAHATVGRGVARVVLPSAEADAAAQAFGEAVFDGTRIFERLPAALWPALAPTVADSLLALRTRDAFDPERILNPGILGESPTARVSS